MANPTNSATPNFNDLREQLRQVLDDQGDYNNLLKDSIKSLDKMRDFYTLVETKLELLNKGSINLKETNTQLLKVQLKQSIEQKKYDDLFSRASDESKLNLHLAKSQAEKDKAAAIAAGDRFNEAEKLLEYLSDMGDLEAVQLLAFEKSNDLAKEQVKISQEHLENEKDISDQIGLSGGAVMKLAKNYGLILREGEILVR